MGCCDTSTPQPIGVPARSHGDDWHHPSCGRKYLHNFGVVGAGSGLILNDARQGAPFPTTKPSSVGLAGRSASALRRHRRIVAAPVNPQLLGDGQHPSLGEYGRPIVGNQFDEWPT